MTQVRTQPPLEVKHYLDGFMGGFAGIANVIMQLSWPAVGYGVMESPVESGSALKHPIKRGRTTTTYLAVALLGTDQDKAKFRQAVNKVHAQIRSAPDAKVAYNAFDKELQLWVGACLYKGTIDIIEALHGPQTDEIYDFLYDELSCYATSLQVPKSMWPVDRQAFAQYWAEGIAKADIDDAVRAYLWKLLRLRNVVPPLRWLLAPLLIWVTTGFLPQDLRDQMGLAWSPADQRRFTRAMRLLGRFSRSLPLPLRNFPLNFYVYETRFRRRFKLALV